MKKQYLLHLNAKDFFDFAKAIEEHKADLKRKTAELTRRLALLGHNVAAIGFSNAIYDGTNDVTVTVDDRGENIKAVVATGSATLFIEFGTGVYYPDTHPEAAANGMIRGGYGKGHGNRQAWGYYGDPGTNGYMPPDKNGLVITHGNPANMPMYLAAQHIRQILPSLAREVFGQ